MQKLKKFIPNSLYGRFLLMIVVPALIVQLVSIYVFFYSHFDLISKYMARNVTEEMAFIKESIAKPGYENLAEDFSRNVDLKFFLEEKRRLKRKKIADSDWKRSKTYEYIKPLIDPYNRFKSELKERHLTPYEIFENPDNVNFLIVKVQNSQGVISFYVPKKRITSSSGYVFTFWMVITAFITSIISIIFLRNQIRPVRELSDAAEKFGRGQDAPNLHPYGSQEIRSLAISFIKMKERVMRQISQRTDMLSAVSHDLRTPLTRMKLQLEMMKSNPEIDELRQDIADMERLVEEYLDFAKVDSREKNTVVKIKEFLQKNLVDYYAKMNKKVESSLGLSELLEVQIRKTSFRRALMNLLDNAFNYGSKVFLEARISDNNLMITIDDDGPGIPESERDNVFKPFYRVDNSRNLDKKIASGGSGLGLAIAMDAITSHGGRIKLAENSLGGLRVLIYIPI